MQITGSARVCGKISGIALDADSAIENNLPYAKYIVFGNGSSTVAKEAIRLSISADVSRGVASAAYSASLDADGYEGAEFSFAGLSADGTSLVCRADFDPVTVTAAKPLNAEFTVVLNVSDGSEKALCGGDNPLVRFLLGAESLSENVFAVTGDCDADNEFFDRDFVAESPLPAVLTFQSGSVKVQTQVPDSATEAVVFIGGRAALRTYLHRGGEIPMIISSTDVFSDGCANLGLAGAKAIGYCTGTYGNHSDAVLVRTADKMYRLKNALGFCVGRGAEIRTDELNEFAAIGNAKEIMLISGKSGLPKYLFSVSREDGEDFAVCAGGNLVKIGEKVTVYDSGGNATEYDVSGGSDNAVARDGNAFHFARVNNERVERFLLSGGEATELPALSLSGGIKLFRNLFRIGVVSNDKCYLLGQYAGVDTDFGYFRSSRLEEIAERAGGVSNVTFGGGLVSFAEDGGTVIASVDGTDEFVLSGADRQAVLFGDYVICRGSGGADVKFFDRGKRVLSSVSGYEEKEITGADRVGDYLLTVSGNGDAEIYYLRKGGSYVYCPSARAQEKLRLAVEVCANPHEGKEKVSVVFEVGLL